MLIYSSKSAGVSKQGKEGRAGVAEREQGGQGCVLVVDDDPVVRRLVCNILSAKGYDTMEAACGEDAVVTIGHNLDSLSLVITDVVMPGMCGIQLAKWLQQEDPSIPILLMSGYVLAELSDFRNPPLLLSKPFTVSALLAKVRQAIDMRT
jgi:two-component system, cell cycle sensor histidine kinase and response regulator CckA